MSILGFGGFVPFSSFSLHMDHFGFDYENAHGSMESMKSTFRDSTDKGYYTLQEEDTVFSITGLSYVSTGTLTFSAWPSPSPIVLPVNGDRPPTHFWTAYLSATCTMRIMPVVDYNTIPRSEWINIGRPMLDNIRKQPLKDNLPLLFRLASHNHIVFFINTPPCPPGLLIHFDSPQTLGQKWLESLADLAFWKI